MLWVETAKDSYSTHAAPRSIRDMGRRAVESGPAHWWPKNAPQIDAEAGKSMSHGAPRSNLSPLQFHTTPVTTYYCDTDCNMVEFRCHWNHTVQYHPCGASSVSRRPNCSLLLE